MKDHSGVRREFVLTAFSIHPSAEIYRRVEEEAVASGKASPHSISQESIEMGVLSEGISSISSEETEGKETVADYTVNNDSQDSGAFVEVRFCFWNSFFCFHTEMHNMKLVDFRFPIGVHITYRTTASDLKVNYVSSAVTLRERKQQIFQLNSNR